MANEYPDMPNTELPYGGDFALGAISQIGVNVKQLPRALRFYREVLRLSQLSETAGMAILDAGGLRLMLSEAQQPELDHPSSILYFTVPDIRLGYQALVERGVHFASPPHCIARLESTEVWMAFFRDSEGNVLALMSEQSPE